MEVSAYDIASRFIGIKEAKGSIDNPMILGMLRLDNEWPQHDEVPWCSAFVNYVAWLLRLPRSKDLRARSWLRVGEVVTVPKVGFDIVILKRGGRGQPDADVVDAPGHVGFYAGRDVGRDCIAILGGNQGDSVTVANFQAGRILGYRRLL